MGQDIFVLKLDETTQNVKLIQLSIEGQICNYLLKYTFGKLICTQT